MATEAATSTTATVTLPSALAFLVSNFHSLVNIKLDASNYLLWRVQIESVMEANGFYGYLDGSIEPPPTQICDTQGDLVLNPAYSLWRLIDSQLKSCLTASLSQITLPYVLGLRSAHQIWISLSNRYNSLSETHVQELKDQLYNLSKTASIDSYIDKIKELAQKLAAAGSPIQDDELVFRTLHGLPKAFNGLKTVVRAVRARGYSLSFDEVVTMLKSEDIQLIQDSPSDAAVHNSSVLVATHDQQIRPDTLPNSNKGSSSQFSVSIPIQYGNSSHSGSFGSSSQPMPFGQPHMFGYQNPFVFPQFGAQQFGGSQLVSPQFGTQFVPQQFGPQPFGSFRGFSRGRGRGPRMPCEICGRSNHSTNWCHYRPPQLNYFSQMSSPVQWGGANTSGQ